jgi:hypothetical protein
MRGKALQSNSELPHAILMTLAAFIAIYSFYLRSPESYAVSGIERYSLAVGEALGAGE